MLKFKNKKQTENKSGKELLNEKLIKQVTELEEQVESLKQELEFERNKPKDGYEEAKKLIVELEKKKQEYQSLMNEVYKVRDSYNQKIAETMEIKAKYSAELDKLLSEIKDGIKTKKNKFKLQNEI